MTKRSGKLARQKRRDSANDRAKLRTENDPNYLAERKAREAKYPGRA